MKTLGLGRGNEQDLSWVDALPPEEIAALCFADPVLFCRYFLPHLFPTPMPWVHRAVLAVLLRRTAFLAHYGDLERIFKNFRAVDGQPIFVWVGNEIGLRLGRYTILLLPRGMSKTTLAAQAVPLFKILYQLCPFLFYLSESATHARMQASNVRRELSGDGNYRIQRVFGGLKPKMSDEEKWAEHFFETLTGMAVGTQGRGGQVRGINHRGQRPLEIIVDDVEDKESVKEQEQRQKTLQWYFGDVLPALPQVGDKGTITLLGTLLHQDALLVNLSLSRRYTTVRMGALDIDAEPVWPEYMDRQKYDATKLEYAARGMLDLFHMEYDNQIVLNDNSPFQRRYLHYSPMPPLDELRIAVYCDPAISKDRRADEAVIVAVGMHKSGRIYVLEDWGKIGATPREIVDTFFTIRAKFGKPRVSGVESNGYQAALVHLLREEMFRKRDYFEVEPVTHRSKKEERIAGILQPRYAAGYVLHCRNFPELETQLLEWPNPRRKDRADALAGAVALLDPYAAEAAGATDLSEDEMPTLEEELGGEWRRI